MPADSLKPLDSSAFDVWKAQHLLNRAGFGGTPEQVKILAGMGLDAAVDHLVDYESAPAPPVAADEFDHGIMRPATEAERMEFAQARQRGDERALEALREERQRRERADRQQMGRLQRWWLKRMIETARPLEEKMTLFWHGHFATGYRTVEDSYHMFLQNQFLRRHATGSFADLVHGIVRDPAMLRYLSNDQNRRQSPNENLARELMELFTLGEGRVYTEQDIKEGARALTGHGFDDDRFIFRTEQHDRGKKTILGQTGRWNGGDFCRIILSQKVVSENICWKLHRFFVSDRPGAPDKDAQAFITKLAREFREHDYALKPVLKILFKSQHFHDPTHIASMIKSPMQLIIQTLRSWRTPVRSLVALADAADLMGQSVFFPPTVKGWEGGRTWINTSTLFVRHNLAIYLLTGRRPDAHEWDSGHEPFDAASLAARLAEPGEAMTVQSTAANLLRFSFGTTPSPERVQTLVDVADAMGGKLDNTTLVAMLSLIAAMPEFQLC